MGRDAWGEEAEEKEEERREGRSRKWGRREVGELDPIQPYENISAQCSLESPQKLTARCSYV